MERTRLPTQNNKAQGSESGMGASLLGIMSAKSAGSDDDTRIEDNASSVGSAQHEEMKYLYCDYSAEVDSAPVDRKSLLFRSTTAENEESDMKFPAKLYEILSRDKYHHIISWLPHGRSFKIWNTSLLEEEVLPHFFDSANYNSFVRLLNAWKYRRITRSNKNSKSNKEDFNSYYHELFLRGMPHLLARMKRLPKKMRKLPMDKSAEPDFSKFPPMPLQYETSYVMNEPPSRGAEQDFHSAAKHPLLGGLYSSQRGLLETHHPQLGMDPQHSVGSYNSLMLQRAASSAAIMEARERKRTIDNALIQQLAAMQSQQPLRCGLSLDPFHGAMPMTPQEQMMRARLGLDPNGLSLKSTAPDVLPLPSFLGMNSARENNRWSTNQHVMPHMSDFAGSLAAAASGASNDPDRRLLDLYSGATANRRLSSSSNLATGSAGMYASGMGAARGRMGLQQSHGVNNMHPSSLSLSNSAILQNSHLMTAEIMERARKRRRQSENPEDRIFEEW
jgi:hypothetical protein